jgi:hypothetical protein
MLEIGGLAVPLYNCPRCFGKVRIRPDLVGRAFTCPKCKEPFMPDPAQPPGGPGEDIPGEPAARASGTSVPRVAPAGRDHTAHHRGRPKRSKEDTIAAVAIWVPVALWATGWFTKSAVEVSHSLAAPDQLAAAAVGCFYIVIGYVVGHAANFIVRG